MNDHVSSNILLMNQLNYEEESSIINRSSIRYKIKVTLFSHQWFTCFAWLLMFNRRRRKWSIKAIKWLHVIDDDFFISFSLSYHWLTVSMYFNIQFHVNVIHFKCKVKHICTLLFTKMQTYLSWREFQFNSDQSSWNVYGAYFFSLSFIWGTAKDA